MTKFKSNIQWHTTNAICNRDRCVVIDCRFHNRKYHRSIRTNGMPFWISFLIIYFDSRIYADHLDMAWRLWVISVKRFPFEFSLIRIASCIFVEFELFDISWAAQSFQWNLWEQLIGWPLHSRRWSQKAPWTAFAKRIYSSVTTARFASPGQSRRQIISSNQIITN